MMYFLFLYFFYTCFYFVPSGICSQRLAHHKRLEPPGKLDPHEAPARRYLPVRQSARNNRNYEFNAFRALLVRANEPRRICKTVVHMQLTLLYFIFHALARKKSISDTESIENSPTLTYNAKIIFYFDYVQFATHSIHIMNYTPSL